MAMLEGYDERFRGWLAGAMSSAGGDPAALFDAFGSRFAAPDFRGCASINTMVEVTDAAEPAHRAAVEHKQKVTADLDAWLAGAGRADHAALAQQFLLLIDGAMIGALRERGPAPAERARSIAQAILSVSSSAVDPAGGPCHQLSSPRR